MPETEDTLSRFRRGYAVIPLTCPPSAQEGCSGTLTITLIEEHSRRARAVLAVCSRGCRSLSSTHYEARAGKKIKLHAHIASFGRRLLAQKRSLRVRLTATSVSGGKIATSVKTVVLRAAGRAVA